MNLYEAIKARRSVRKFKSDPVPQELVMKVLDAANWAPSGMNQQPWKFYIIQGQKLSSVARDFGTMVEKNMPPQAERDDKMQARLTFIKTFGGAPLLIIATMPKDEQRSKVHAQSLGAAFQNMLLAAHVEGLGTCWMVHPLIVSDAIRAAAAIPENEELFAVTPLGYAEVVPDPVPRVDPELNNKVVWVK